MRRVRIASLAITAILVAVAVLAAPSIGNVILSSSSGQNLTSDNLSVSFTANGTANATDWRVDGTSIAVLDLPFDENVSSLAQGAVADISTYGNNGTLGNTSSINAPIWTSAGRIGGAYRFDAKNKTSMILVPNSPSFDLTRSFTILYWMNASKRQPANWPRLVSKGYLSAFDIDLDVNSSYATVIVVHATNGSNRYVAAGTGLNDSLWHFVAFTWNGTRLRSYLDGSPSGSTPFTGTPVTNSNPVWIGSLDYSFPFNGTIDDVRIYRRALSSQQIASIYADESGGAPMTTLVSQETSPGETWECFVRSSNPTASASAASNNLTIIDRAPIVGNVTLSSSSSQNTTSDNLTVSYTTSDPDNQAIATSVDWRLDGASIAILDLPLDENVTNTTSGAIKDSSTHRNDGTLGGGNSSDVPTYTDSCVIGGCYEFNGINDSIWFPNATLPSTNFTIALWIKPKSIYNYDHAIAFGYYHEATIYLTNNTNDIAFKFSNVSGVTVDKSFDAYHENVWTFYTVTYDGVNFRAYTNGSLVYTYYAPGKVLFSQKGMYLGRVSAAIYDGFNGSIDGVLVLNRTLTAEQIASIYDQERNGQPASILSAQETEPGEMWSAAVTASDGTKSTTVLSNNLTIIDRAPVIGNVTLTSSSPDNLTTGSLSVTYNASDPDNQTVTTSVDWRVNGTSIAVLDMPFDANTTAHTNGPIVDRSTYGNNGTFGNTDPYYQPNWISNGVVGGAYYFRGYYENISIPSSPSLDLTSGFTIMFWMNASRNQTSSYPTVISKGLSTTGGVSWIVDLAAPAPAYHADIGLNDSSTLTYAGVPTSLNDSVWHQIAYTWNGSTIRVYLDGVPVSSKPFAGPLTTNSEPVYMSDIKGSLDQLKIFDRPLTSSQIAAIYDDESAGHAGTKIVSDETSPGERWSAAVTASDGTKTTTTLSNELTTVTIPAALGSVTLSSSSGQNLTSDNLSVSFTANGTANATDWRVDGESIAALNAPFEINKSGTFTSIDTAHRNLTIAGDVNWVDQGIVGGAYRFSNYTSHPCIVGDRMSVPQAYTISEWVRGNASDQNASVNVYGGGWDGRISIRLAMVGQVNTTGISIYNTTGGNVTSVYAWNDSNGVIDGAWHNVVATVSNATKKVLVYRDGVEIANGTIDATRFFGSTNTTIGCWQPSYGNFIGEIDQFVIYRRALSPEQVHALYTAESSGHALKEQTTQETEPGQTWSVAVTASNGTKTVTTLSNNLTIIDRAPIVANVTLSSSSAQNLTNDNLTITYNASDPDNQTVSTSVDWRVDGASIAVLDLPFDENVSNATTGAVKDLSTHANNATLGSGNPNRVPVWTPNGISGGAYVFNGSDKISVPYDASLNLSDNFTVMLWAKTNKAQNQSYPFIISAGSNQAWQIYIDCTLGCTVNAALYNTSGQAIWIGYGAINTSTWDHLAFTFNGTNARFYLNGSLLTNKRFHGTLATGSYPISIGYDGGGGSYYAGSIDDVKIFRRVLTATQIKNIYESGRTGLPTTKLDSSETAPGQTWSAAVTASDGTKRTTALTNNLTITDRAPVIGNVTLSSSSAQNVTTDNLTVNYTASDPDNQTVATSVDWRVNGTSIAVLDIPFDVNVSSVATGAVADLSTYGNNGTLGGGLVQRRPKWSTDCVIGGCYVFSGNTNGENDTISLGNIPLNGSFTLMAWVRYRGTPSPLQNLIFGEEQYLVSGFRLGLAATNVSMIQFWTDQSGGNGHPGTTPILPNVWYHVAATYENGTGKIYLDGVRDAAVPMNYTPSTYPFLISPGEDMGVAAWNGTIDQVHVFRPALSDQQVKAIYDAEASGHPASKILSSETKPGETWSAAVTASDGTKRTTALTNNLTITDRAPVIGNVTLSSSSGKSLTTDNLSVTYTASDPDGQKLTETSDWREGGTSIDSLHLTFDENSTTIPDLSGQGNDGRIFGTSTLAWHANCVIGGCYVFNGKNASIAVNDSPALRLDGASGSIVAWARLDRTANGSANGTIVSKFDGSYHNGYWLGYYDGNARLVFYNATGAATSLYFIGTFNDSTWHQFAATWNGSRIDLYVDGVHNRNATYTHGITGSNTTLRIGATNVPSEGSFIGAIDDLVISNRRLSAKQIALSYAAGQNGTGVEPLSSDETKPGDIWNAAVTASDGMKRTTALSNNLTIQHTLNVSLRSPDQSSVTPQDPILSCTASSIGSIANVSVLTNQSGIMTIERTNSSIGTNATNTTFALNGLTTGSYTWSCEACNAYECRQSANRTIIVDTTPPSIAWNAPTPANDSILGAGSTLSLNLTSSDTHPGSIVTELNGSLQGWWTFDAPNGTSVSDESGHARTATIHGTPTHISGVRGNALEFHGLDNGEYVLLSSGLPNAASNFTLEAWFDAYDSEQPFSSIIGGINNPRITFNTATQDRMIEFFANNASPGWNVLDSDPVTLNHWHQVVVTVENANSSKPTAKMYIDGKFLSWQNNTLNGPIQGLNQPLYVNRIDNHTRFDGAIDDVRVYSRALSAAEVSAGYNASVSAFSYTGLNSGTYAVDAFSEDAAGNINSSGQRVVHINTVPRLSNVTLASSNGQNLTDGNLTVSFTASDPDNQTVATSSDWRVDGKSIALVNLQFDTNVSTTGINDVPSLATWSSGGQLGYGVASEAPVWIPNGHSSGAYRFDGINDTLYARHPAAWDNFTIMAWFETNETIAIQNESTSGASGTSGQHWLLYPWYGNATSAGAGISVGTNGIGVYEHGPAYLPALAVYNGTLRAGWNHVTIVYTDRRPSIYLNGLLVKTGLRSNESRVYASYQLGGAAYGWLNGTIDGFEILNRSLSASQVAAIYAEENATGTWTSIAPQETAPGDTWSVKLTASDGIDETSALSNNLTIGDRAPVIGNVTLSSSSGTNGTNENLSVTYNASDPDGQTPTETADWRVGGQSIAVLNLPFNTDVSATSAGAIRDVSTYGNNGTLGGQSANASGPPRWIRDGAVGGAYRFNGSSTLIVPASPSLNLTDNFTAMLWSRSEPTQGGPYLFMLSAGVNQKWEIYLDCTSGCNPSAGIFNSTGGGTWIGYGTGFNNSVWEHLAITVSGDNFSLYVDGVLRKSTLFSGSLNGQNYPIWLGGDSGGGSLYNGSLDEVHIFDRALSPEQIKTIYDAEKNGKPDTALVSQETTPSEVWSVAVTASDGMKSTTVRSNNLTIRGPQCGVISNDTTLTNDVTAPGACFNITASNVVLDCAGHAITYATSRIGVGVQVAQNVANVTIENCRIAEGSSLGGSNQTEAAGISIQGALGSESRDVTVTNTSVTALGHSSQALFANYSLNLTISGSSFQSNGSNADAAWLRESDGYRINGSTFRTDGAYANAISCQTSRNGVINRSELDVSATGSAGFAAEGDCIEPLISRSTISGGNGSTIFMDLPSNGMNVSLVDTNLSGTISFYSNTSGTLRAGWYVELHVQDPSSNPVSANVSYAAQGSNASIDPTRTGAVAISSSGQKKIVLYGYSENQTGTYDYEQYAFNATKHGYTRNATKSANITANTDLTFTVQNDRSTSAPALSAPAFTNHNVSLTATVDPDAATVDWSLLNASNLSETIRSGTLTKQSSTKWSGTVPLSIEGTYTLRVNVTDTVGNTASASKNVTYDTTPPTITTFTCSAVARGQDPSCTCIAEDASTLKGGTLTASYSGDTSLTGTGTATCTATDEAGNRASRQASFTVTGGGGVVATLAPNRAERTWVEVSAGQTIELDVNRSGLAVSQVSLSAASSATGAQVVVTNGTSTSERYGMPSKDTYGSFEVSSTLNASRARIVFHVPRGSFDPTSIVLYRYDNGWAAQPTQLVSNGSELTYASEVSGLGVFTIGTRATGSERPTVTLQPGTSNATSPPNASGASPSGTRPRRRSLPWIPLAAIAAATIIAVAWIVTRPGRR